ncbi:MAG: hypothetical protein ACLGI6_01130 [Gammaproteobacteria bacterium]
MSEYLIKIPSASDKTIVDVFSEIGRNYGCAVNGGMAVGDISLGPLRTQNDGSGLPDEWAKILELNSAVIRHLSISIQGLTLMYYRRGRDHSSPIYDEILIQTTQNPGLEATARLEIISEVTRRLKAFDPERSLNTPIPEHAVLAALHESTLTRLEQTAADIIRQGAEVGVRLEEQFTDRRMHLESELESRKREQDTRLNAELLKLEAVEAELNERLKKVDDRNNTHARREIRERMLDDVKARIQNFGVSQATEKKRLPVKGGIVLMILFILALLLSPELFSRMQQLPESKRSDPSQAAAANSSVAVPHKTPPSSSLGVSSTAESTPFDHYWSMLRISLLSAGLIGTVLYYVRWQNRWAEQHSASEFQLQQFYLDVNRANWIIESGLEWRKETGSDMPETLLASVSRNLFNREHEPAPALHPADELASALLGSASKVKIKAGDNELDFDKPKAIPN